MTLTNAIGVALLALITTIALIAMSLAANRRFAAHARLPMQWSLPLRKPWADCVNWTAPRAFALSLLPALAIPAEALLVYFTLSQAPRPGQEAEVIPAALFTSTILIAVHALHLWLIDRTLQEA